jgi:membrane protease YdiL (CAAX protease family)
VALSETTLLKISSYWENNGCGFTDRRDWMRRVVFFFLVTFALTWALWSIAASGQRAPLGIGGAVFRTGVFAPALVAFLFTSREHGREGVTSLIARIGRVPVRLRWYLFALAYMPALKLSAAVMTRITTGHWPAFGETRWFLVIGAIVVSTWVQAGEEIGWRGYALPRLAGLIGLNAASVILGAVWALWHLPLFFMPDTGSQGQSFAIYLLSVTATSVAMAWLYWRSGGSLLLTMVMHAAINNTSEIVPAALPSAGGVFTLAGTSVAWWTVVLSWLVAMPLLVQMNGARTAHGASAVAV